MKYQTIHIDYVRELKEKEQFKNDFNSMIRGLKLGLIIAFLIILLVYAFSGRISLVNGDGNIYYTFQNDNMFNATSSYNFESGYPSDTINVRDSQEYGENYSATYSFDNDIGLTNLSIPYIDGMISPDSNVVVLSEYCGHDSVLYLYATGSAYSYYYNLFGVDVSIGTFEFWFCKNDTSKSRINVRSEGNNIFGFYFQEDYDIEVYGVGTYDTGVHWFPDLWVHIRTDFNCTSDTFDVYINGVLVVDDYGFLSGCDYIDRILYGHTDADSTIYFDAIGYYWYEYKGSYTFQDEVGEENLDIDFIDEITGTASDKHVEVEEFVYNHRSVMNVSAGDGSNYISATHNIGGNVVSGSMDWYQYRTGGTGYVRVYGTNDDVTPIEIMRIYVYDAVARFYYSGTSKTVAIPLNQLALVYISFNFTSDTWTAYANGELAFENYPFYNDNVANRMFKYLINVYGNAGSTTACYIDSINFSWEDSYDITEQITNYTIGQNIIPLLENTDYTYEADKWTFRYNENDITDLLDDGTDNPNGWTDIDPTQDYVNIQHDAPYYADGYVNITSYAPLTSDRGIYKEFDYETGIINVTWTTNMTDIGGTGTEFYTKIYSYDDTLLTKVFFEYGVGGHYLEYNDGSDHILYSTLSEGEEYTINVYINNNDNLACLTLYTNGVFNATHYITLANYEDGLGKIEFEITGSTTYDQEIHLDDIGVYINGTSITSEPAILKTLTLTANEPIPYYWYFQEFNLFSFNMTGNSSIYLTETGYLEEISTIEQLAPYDYYNLSLEQINLYDFTFNALTYIDPCQLWFMFNNQYNFNSVSIDGVKLDDGTYEYIPTFDYGNVDPNESYFYVLSNSLYFYFQPDYPADYEEWISLSFDIDDFESTDYRLQFTGDKNNNSDVLFRLIWYDWIYTDIELGTTPTTFRLLLPTERTCDEVQFWAFSFYENQSALTSGYFSSFTMVYKPDFTDFSALSFVGIIPLLIMILGIPILLYVRTGVRKIIVPSVVIMSIFSVAFGIMDVWLFVATMALIVAYFILKRKVDFE